VRSQSTKGAWALRRGEHSVSMRAVIKANCLAFISSEPKAMCFLAQPSALFRLNLLGRIIYSTALANAETSSGDTYSPR
jgi:hypothetical protein